MQTIFITGGAGYLGTNISLVALQKGYSVVVLDNFENSYTKNINKLKKLYPDTLFVYKGDVRNKLILEHIFVKHKVSTVVHLAAYKYVGESISNPQKYYSNNMGSLEKILDCAERYGVEKFAFASSAVVYGNPKTYPTIESEVLSPLSPYAETKARGEEMISEWNKRTNIPAVIYRFSNPVGAERTYKFGDESKKGVLNLLPYIVTNTLINKPMQFKGNNHDTTDGTAVRDYIYVCDLAKTVISVLEQYNSNTCEIINVSRGKGFSVLNMLNTVEEELNKRANYTFKPKNEEEASISLLSCEKLNKKYNLYLDTDLKDIVESEIDFRN